MRIGEVFKNAGLISSEALETALKEQETSHDRLGDIMLRNGVVTPEKMAPVLADYFQIPFINIKDIYKDISSEVIDYIPSELAQRFTAIPVEQKDGALTIAIFDPLNLQALDTFRLKTGMKIQCVVAVENDIKEAIEYCYHNLPRMKEHIDSFIQLEVKDHGLKDETDRVQFGADDQPVVQYVKSLIIQAVNNRASDIHLQPKQDKAELRLRIDGTLYSQDPPPKAMLPAISARVKIISGLDIAEKRLPQDGRIRVVIGKSEVDIRTSVFPTIYGESVVLRILDTSTPLSGMEELGFEEKDLAKFRRIIHYAYGLILVTGPTGSGKTTTLYTTLNEIKSAEKNIITIEDPVEYRLPFIQQSQVNPAIGFDFARGLRSILRQDPDIIMVGEIRDRETAEIAIHAALTGHLVFATLHTNDSAGAPVRMINMGVEPFLITSSLLGVVAQRLVRTICPHCRYEYDVSREALAKVSSELKMAKLARGRGCPKCFKSGYMGRKGIYEVLVPDENIRRLILNNRSSEEIRAAAQKIGMKTLREAGIEKLKAGVTTLEEICRITQETEEN
ncbi:MAG: type II/IV secretion system protein [Candidatus Omnitrophica bacterium]|nr:type II/IV secretion system protein [Candidatus Omnitrophota bacterium]